MKFIMQLTTEKEINVSVGIENDDKSKWIELGIDTYVVDLNLEEAKKVRYMLEGAITDMEQSDKSVFNRYMLRGNPLDNVTLCNS